MSISNRIWFLMSRKFSGAATPEERLELERLMRDNVEAQYTYEVLQILWPVNIAEIPSQNEQEGMPDQPGCNDLSGDGTGRNWDLHLIDEWAAPADTAQEQAVTRIRRFQAGSFYRVAGVCTGVIFLLAAGYWWHYRPIEKNETRSLAGINEIITRHRSRTNIVLPDGTKVFLNGGSKLVYPGNIALADTREVSLVGEAYFEVRHDAQHPFVIHTPTIDIKDIGTSFNVKSYPGDAKTEATLIEGAIEVFLRKGMGKSILLHPMEKVTFFNVPFEKQLKKTVHKEEPGADLYKVSHIAVDPTYNIYPETAWLENKIVFRNQTIEELAGELERRYDVKITISDEQIGQYRVTGIFEDETIQQALNELKLIVPFNYKIKNNEVFISP